MKYIRLPIQVIALLLQIYYFIETIRLYTCGYVVYGGKPIESSWFSLLFTLLVVFACEILSFADAVLLLVSKRNIYNFIYLAATVENAFLFMGLAYYSTVGTIVCISFYALLFIARIVNLVLNLIQIIKNFEGSILVIAVSHQPALPQQSEGGFRAKPPESNYTRN